MRPSSMGFREYWIVADNLFLKFCDLKNLLSVISVFDYRQQIFVERGLWKIVSC